MPLRPVLTATICLALSLTALAAPLPPPPGQPAEKEIRIPSKWLKKAKGYEEALELQKQTEADIILYFSRMAPPDQKGLCKWWETKGIKTMPMSRLLKEYVKAQITLPSNSADEDLAEAFGVKHCPTVVVVHPDGSKRYAKVFDWPQGKPKLKDADELVEHIRSLSSERYQLKE